MNTLQHFDNDQRLLLNGAFENENLSTFSKEKMLNILEFGKIGCGETELLDVYDDMMKKIQRFSAEEWDDLKRQVPLSVSYDENAADGEFELNQ